MNHIPRYLLRNIQRGPRLLYRLGLGPLLGRWVLLLTTVGRKSGLPRTTPLQFEEIDGVLYVASALGEKADWYRNLVACPEVLIQIGPGRYPARAEPLAESKARQEFLFQRLQRHPRMIGAILRAEGIDPKDKAAVAGYARTIAVVRLTPR